MAYIILPRRWQRQPRGAVGIDYSNWLGARVLAAYRTGQWMFSGPNGGPLSLGAGSFLVTPHDGGLGFRNNGSSHLTMPRSPFKDSTSPCSISFLCRLDATVAFGGLFASVPPGAANNSLLMWSSNTGYYLTVGRSAANAPFRFNNLTQPAVGTVARVVVTMAGGPISTTAADYAAFHNRIKYIDIGTVTWGGAGATTQMIGHDNQNTRWNGLVDDVVVFDGVLPDAAAFAYLEAPYQIYRGRHSKIFVGAGSGVTSYTLTADAGSYAVTGSDATTKVARRLTSDAGAYTLTGSDATLKAGRVVGANAGSYTYTGSDAAFARTYAVAADAGAYTYTGSDATLTYTPSGSTYTLTADAGSYTVTGSDASTLVARKVSAEAGSYALTGSDATLTRGFVVTASAGSYTYTGSDATFSRTYALAADNGIYVLSGSDATLTYSGAPAAAPSAEQPVGGWPRRRPAIDRRVPTEEEVRRERERLGILPPRAQKVLRRIVAEISDEPELEQVAEALKPEPLAERVRKELRDSGAYFQKRNADIYPQIIAALVLDSLQRKGALDAELLAEQQEADLVNNVLLPMWLNL